MIIAENSWSIFLLDDEKCFIICIVYFTSYSVYIQELTSPFFLAGETNLPSHLVSALGSRLCAHKATRRHAG